MQVNCEQLPGQSNKGKGLHKSIEKASFWNQSAIQFSFEKNG